VTLPGVEGVLNIQYRTTCQSYLMSSRRALKAVWKHYYPEAAKAYGEGDILLQYIMTHYAYELRRFAATARDL
jgi:hypothetical protein